MPSKRWRAVLGGAAAALVLLSAGCGGAGQAANNTTANATAATLPPDKTYTGQVVATYAGGQIRKDELDQMYNLLVVLPQTQNPPSKRNFLTDYAQFKYMYDEARQAVKTPPNAQTVQQESDQTIQQWVDAGMYKSKQAVLDKMKSLGLTQTDLTRFLAQREWVMTYIQDQLNTITVSDAEIQNYYNQHKSDYIQVTVDQILVNSEQQAKDIEAQLKKGANFATLADKYSQDPSVSQNHGKLENQLVSDFVPEFANACRTLPIGQISDPVHTQYGYHILRVDKRTQLSLDQVKSDIQQTLLQQKQQDKEQAMEQDAMKKMNLKVLVADKDL
ncbi:MAG: peptidyl-prolyl cis-trans isomerase [Thermoflavifilum sp.]|nr:peptidyl-prolyl cis-trans isomerase [Thermoflavifilum sp.]MCL6513747.1 peptidylprolyl isomerase [Alicyclobacillus sp.]